MGGWWGEYNFTCQPVDKSHSPTAMRVSCPPAQGVHFTGLLSRLYIYISQISYDLGGLTELGL